MTTLLDTKLAEMSDARTRTLELFSLATEEDLRRSPGFGFRPVLWHLAHIGVFEAYWLLQKLKGDAPVDDRYERIFDPIATPRETVVNLPTRDEMEEFLRRVRVQVEDYLSNATLGETNPLTRGGYVLDLVIEHERQHQETLAYLLHLLDPTRKRRPASVEIPKAAPTIDDKRDTPESFVAASPAMVEIPAGSCVVGASWNSFAYDNELPPHEVALQSFRIARLPVTNGEYEEFISEGGYTRSELWSAEGWACREREGWTAPLYWESEGSAWHARTMFDTVTVAPDHPVGGISWHEAEAYARFRNARLPTEAEWEKAASWDADANRKRLYAWGDESPTQAHCNFDLRAWGTTPVGAHPRGASTYGCLDMTGNVWEWTSDAFAPFAGFAAFPYPEYSEKWFDGDHRVLKGGSWATSTSVLRTSFRNFFRRDFRIAFAGLRLAEDA